MSGYAPVDDVGAYVRGSYIAEVKGTHNKSPSFVASLPEGHNFPRNGKNTFCQAFAPPEGAIMNGTKRLRAAALLNVQDACREWDASLPLDKPVKKKKKV